MCGIAGIVDFDNSVDPAQVSEMLRLIDHRGPDDSGLHAEPGLAIGACRLAILDLSSAGHQPMTDETGRYRLVYNGEIYNYRELRSELESLGHRFHSGTDTEVVLSAFRQWGERSVERFNGMWAFALWDSEQRSLFCSRDRLGIKPFYFRRDGSRFIFGSELREFAVAAGRPRPNLRIVRDFIEFGTLDHVSETFFEGIEKLPPGTSATLDSRGFRTHRYWELRPTEAVLADPVEQVRETLLDALRLHLRSDVPIGTCLSGGLDSSAIACGVDRILRAPGAEVPEASRSPRQKTFTAFFERPGYDERPYAELVVDQIGAEPHWITFSGERMIEELPLIVAAQEEPFGSASIVAQWFVMKAAREAGIKVMLDGQGGDEIFAGYLTSFGPRFADLVLGGRIREFAREAQAFRRMQGAGAGDVATALVRGALPEGIVDRVRGRRSGASTLVHPALRSLGRPATNGRKAMPTRLQRHLEELLLRRQLPELLRYEDRNSMAHSIEARVPLLDYRLVELLFSLDARVLIEGGRTKILLRRAFADILPPAVRDRTDKIGFAAPQAWWLLGPLGELAASVFASDAFRQRGFVDADAASARLQRQRQGDVAAGFEVWRALVVELWAQAHFS
jgi:asparagine synthase (glutamine-hydrolysing)